MMVALLVLGLSQATVIFLVKGFLSAFFDNTSEKRASLVVLLPLVVLIAGIAKSWGTYVYTRLQQEFSLLAGAALRDKLFPAILGKSYQELAQVSPGSWMSILVNDVAFVQTRLSEVMTSFLRGGMAVLASLGTMFFLHWPSALVMLFLMPLTARSTGATGKRIAGFSSLVQESLRRMADLVFEVRGRFDFMRAQQGESFDFQRYESANESYFRMITRSILVRSAFAPALEFLGFAVFAGFILAINRGLIGFAPNGERGSELLLQFVVAVGFMVKPMRDIGEQLARYHETQGAVTKCFEMLRSGSTDSLPTEPGVCLAPHGAALPLVVRDISFKWPASGKSFSAHDLTLAPGRSVAVVGPSGAGKSTFLKVLSGLLPPDRWDADSSWESAVERTALVPQQPFLFTATIRENVAYGVPDCHDEDIWAALESIDARQFVQAMPAGLGAPVSSLVANLSGGQIQRLVIARALLRRKHILLLDEATSALDVATEGSILRRITAAAKLNQSAVVAVTHRLQWLPLFDEIWFVEDGGVGLRGTHQELLAVPRFVAFCNSAEGDLS
jgi:ATP-binding cassette subfamily B protein